ncbi:MAG: hypothetical protein ACEPOV_00655 [Hyphomicrobiales bacterium]
MVDFPPSYLINKTLTVGVIYKFKAPEFLENNDTPHYFIVVATYGNDNFLVCCTSQVSKKASYFDRNQLDYNTLVYLAPHKNSPFTKDTVVNCNEYFTISKEKLIKKCSDKSFKLGGNLSLNEYTQIYNGIKNSEVSDIGSFLLHPDEYEKQLK